MGADWYTPFTLYGYEIKVNDDLDLTKFIHDAYQLQLPNGFEIRNILSEFHSRMEGGNNSELDELSTLIIGFEPDNNLEKTIELSKSLEKYIDEFTQLYSISINEFPEFYTGIEWYNEEWGDCESEYDDTDEGCSDSECEEDGSDSKDN